MSFNGWGIGDADFVVYYLLCIYSCKGRMNLHLFMLNLALSLSLSLSHILILIRVLYGWATWHEISL